jgi:hypothetical protein
LRLTHSGVDAADGRFWQILLQKSVAAVVEP